MTRRAAPDADPTPLADRLALAVGAAALLAMALFTATHMRVGNEITHFLPADADASQAYLSRALAQSELTRTMIVAVEGPADVVASATSQLAARLRARPEVAWLRSGVDEAAGEEVYRTFFPRRLMLLSEAPDDELPRRLSDEGLRRAARDARRALGSPMGALVARTVGADPLMSFSDIIRRMQAAQQGALTTRDGQFVTADGRHGVLFLGTRRSPFDARAQRPLLAAIREGFDAVNRAHAGALSLSQSGVNRFAVRSEQHIRGDIERISLVSTLGIVALFMLVHRSLRYLLVAALPLVAGMLFATTAGLLWFGSLHGLTLAFGSSLIGVCFDYPVYVINHHTLYPEAGGPSATLRRVWKGLRLGAMTTIGGLAGLAWTSFPGLREIALFSATGVVGALVATRYLVPPLLPRRPASVLLQRRWAQGLARAATSLRVHPWYAVVPALLAVIVCAFGLPQLRWNDDARALTAVDPELQREDDAVRALVSRVDPGRVVVATGDTDEEAIARNDLVFHRLSDARSRRLVDEFRSLHSVLWSRELQARNLAAVRRSEALHPRLVAAFTAEGFRPGAFDAFARALDEAPPAPLTYDALRATSIADIVRPFRIRVGERVAYLTFVTGVRDAEALRRHVEALPSVAFFDQETFMRSTFSRYRRRTVELMSVGLLAVFALIFARYRQLRLSVSAFVPAVLAATTALAVVGALGVRANLMHLLGTLLVLSIGADYGIFMAETSGHQEQTPATLLSTAVACAATVLSFGLLAMSSNPALRAIGVTTGVGVTLSMLLAPMASFLFNLRASQR